MPLAPLTTLELGGPAAWLVEARTEGELAQALDWARRAGVPTLLIGGGSNLVIGDAGFDGLAVRVGLTGMDVRADGRVRAAAGESWDRLVAATVGRGLAGLECMSGIPGSVGATPVQNVGAYGQEVAERLTAVRVLEPATGRIETLTPEACGFGYRDSRFKREPGRWVVLEVELALEPGGQPRIRYPELARAVGDATADPAGVREAVLRIRRSKSMVWETSDPNHRSVGSFFTNPVVSAEVAEAVRRQAVASGIVDRPDQVPAFPGEGGIKLSAAWLIERSGIRKGTTRGPVGVSTRHCLALVHHGGGTTKALLRLAGEIRAAVRESFGIVLTPEPTLVGTSLDEWGLSLP